MFNRKSALDTFYEVFGRAPKPSQTLPSCPIETFYSYTEFPGGFDYFFPFVPFGEKRAIDLFDAFQGVHTPKKAATKAFFKACRVEAFRRKLILPIFLGHDGRETPKVLDFLSIPNYAITGITGTGKTNLLYQIVIGLLLCAHPEYLKIVLIDNYKADLSVFSPLASFYGLGLGAKKTAGVAFDALLKEADRRQKILKNLPVKDAMEANQYAYKQRDKSFLLPYVVIITDEFFTEEEDIAKLSLLASKCRASGMRIIVSVQNAGVKLISSALKNNMTDRIAFKVGNVHSEFSNLGKANAGTQHLPIGSFNISNLGEVQTIKTQEIEYRLITQMVANLQKNILPAWSFSQN